MPASEAGVPNIGAFGSNRSSALGGSCTRVVKRPTSGWWGGHQPLNLVFDFG